MITGGHEAECATSFKQYKNLKRLTETMLCSLEGAINLAQCIDAQYIAFNHIVI